MEITVDVIKEAIEKTPELKTQIMPLFTDGLVVRTKDEDQQFLDNHLSTVVDERVSKQLQSKVDEQFGQALTKIDNEILAITGVAKQPNEKTTAYAKRVVEEMKAKGGDQITKERVKQLEEALSTTEIDYKKQIEDLQGQLFSRDVNFDVDGGLEGVNIALPVHIKTDEDKTQYITNQKALIKQGFLSSHEGKKDEKGRLVWYEDGKPLLDAKTGDPLKASQIIASKYASWFVPTHHTATGTGTGQRSGVLPQGGFKDKDSIHKYLAANGLEAGEEKYLKEFQRLAEENKIAI